MSQEIIDTVEEYVEDGMLACDDAHQVAEKLGISPLQVGDAVNQDSRFRFSRCQLGLFGYGPKPQGLHKVVLKATHIPEDIGAAIDAQTVSGRISCQAVWDLAKEFHYPRLAMANMIETKGLQVTPCQLGCF